MNLRHTNNLGLEIPITTAMMKDGKPLLYVFLLLLLPAYIAAYLLHPDLPRNGSPNPMGWWSWFDQGQYLRAAWALNLGNLDPQNYFYPPLYPMLGALFVRLSPLHPFFLLDATCFLLFTFFYLDLARRYVGEMVAIATFCVSFVRPLEIGAVWIEPWTSTLVAPLVAFLFWQIDTLLANKVVANHKTLAAMGLAGGMIFASRPVDAVVVLPNFVLIAAIVLRDCRTGSNGILLKQIVQRCGALVIPGLAGVAFFCGFNWIVHGSLGGSYFQVSTSNNGFVAQDLAEKAVAIFLDPTPLYGPTAASVLRRAPQLALVLPGIIFLLLQGPTVLRLLVLICIWQFCIYLPYTDLLPNGFWRYHNVHYFKWMFPYWWLCGVYPLQTLLSHKTNRQQGVGLYATCAMAAAVLLCVQIKLRDISVPTQVHRLDETSHGRIQMVFDTPTELDLISLPTLKGDFAEVYMNYTNTVSIDGEPLRPLRDFRFLPATLDITGMHLLFIRPQTAHIIEINPAALTLLDESAQARCYRYEFTLGWPAWL